MHSFMDTTLYEVHIYIRQRELLPHTPKCALAKRSHDQYCLANHHLLVVPASSRTTPTESTAGEVKGSKIEMQALSLVN